MSVAGDGGAPLGAVYLAFGRPYLAMALLSASTLRRRSPELPICVLTNVLREPPPVGFWEEGRDRWTFLDRPDAENRRVKTRLDAHTPFSRTVFLDCDTKVLGDLSLAGPMLDAFDVALRLKRHPPRAPGKGDRQVLDGVAIQDLPHWNSGVILFRASEPAREFFEIWSSAYARLGASFDQISLVEAVFRSRARVLSLDDRWNATDPVWNRRRWRERSKVFHYASNISDRIRSEVLSYDAVIGGALPGGPGSGETAQFLARKRGSKRAQLGTARYAALRLLWAVSSPA